MGKFTKEQIAEWKKKHGTIYQIDVEDKSCIIRKPNRKDLSYVSATKDPIKLQENLLNQLWVAGDEEIREDDDLFFAAANQLEDVLKVKQAEIKKL